MSTVQKIFVVITFALAVAFTFLSMQMLATEQYWKDKWKAISKDYADKKEELNTVIQAKEEDIKGLEDQRRNNVGQIETLKSKNSTIESLYKEVMNNLNKQTDMVTSLTEDHKILVTQNSDYKARLEDVREKYGRERKRAEDLVKIYNFKQDELADVIAELNDQKSSYRSLQENFKKAEEEAQGWRIVIKELENYGISWRTILAKGGLTTEFPIDAKVLAVSKDKETKNIHMVMLSVGRQDEVEPGFIFIIFRDDKYIGKVMVDKVFNDMAAASVIPESLARDEKGNVLDIKQYDSASTRIY